MPDDNAPTSSVEDSRASTAIVPSGHNEPVAPLCVTADDLSDWLKYSRRSQAVHWYRVPACRKGAGHDHATCILTPGHPGPHYGNGNDEWGPKAALLWANEIERTQ